MGFSGFGVNFIDSITVLMGLKVFLARSEAVTDQLLRDFILTDGKKSPVANRRKQNDTSLKSIPLG